MVILEAIAYFQRIQGLLHPVGRNAINWHRLIAGAFSVAMKRHMRRKGTASMSGINEEIGQVCGIQSLTEMRGIEESFIKLLDNKLDVSLEEIRDIQNDLMDIQERLKKEEESRNTSPWHNRFDLGQEGRFVFTR